MLFSVQCMCCTYIRTYIDTYSIYVHGICTYVIHAYVCVYSILYVQGNLIIEVSFTSLLLICNLLFGGSWCDIWSPAVAHAVGWSLVV